MNPRRREHQWALKGFEYWMKEQRDAGQWNECRYQYQLEGYLEYFDSSKTFVSFLEDWKADRETVVDNCCKFLGIDESQIPTADERKWNRAGDRRIERPVLKAIRATAVFRKLVSPFPVNIREFARQKVAHKKAPLVVFGAVHVEHVSCPG